MSYVDGFVLLIPKKNVKKYQKIAKDAGKIWKKLGALSYMECMGDDMHPKGCEWPFPKMTKCSKNETVWFSFIVYKSKAHRDSVNKKVMKEMERLYPNQSMADMPFNMKKLAFGGFKTLVEY